MLSLAALENKEQINVAPVFLPVFLMLSVFANPTPQNVICNVTLFIVSVNVMLKCQLWASFLGLGGESLSKHKDWKIYHTKVFLAGRGQVLQDQNFVRQPLFKSRTKMDLGCKPAHTGHALLKHQQRNHLCGYNQIISKPEIYQNKDRMEYQIYWNASRYFY